MLSRMLMMKPIVPSGVLVVSFGESNAGGRALNADAPSWELGPRPELRFWNVNTNTFQDMTLGVNNNLDHAGLNNDTHGWELGLANRVRQGYFGARSVHYVQTGQGSSTVAQWSVGGSYWTKFLSRVSAARSALNVTAYTSHVWITLGINDADAGTTDSAYKTAMQEIITRIKAELPGCKIYISTLPGTMPAYDTYSSRIAEIASEDPSRVRVISATSPVAAEMISGDSKHWSYSGMKRLAARLTDATLMDLSLAGNGFTWSAREDANYVYFSASTQGAAVPAALDVTTDGYVAFDCTGVASQGIVCVLDNDTTLFTWSAGSEAFYAGMFNHSGSINEVLVNSAVSDTYATTPCWIRFKWAAANDDIVIETSVDGGSTWTTRKTLTGALSGVSVAYVKAVAASGAAAIDAWRS